nr:hypothetical protein [Escherichia coli]
MVEGGSSKAFTVIKKK